MAVDQPAVAERVAALATSTIAAIAAMPTAQVWIQPRILGLSSASGADSAADPDPSVTPVSAAPTDSDTSYLLVELTGNLRNRRFRLFVTVPGASGRCRDRAGGA
ncbi:hypothetical protein GCM10009764_03670 [Nocardia ninae]|uniref:Uncharacterized protein n=1 Tax=Nocardia ninae NBRC 108245 TaxID=1210091 RepID=A0A511MGA6_9NOCA|nr:hypothetical protein NN4_42420 [Nocardia ninae NBRC 108245]